MATLRWQSLSSTTSEVPDYTDYTKVSIVHGRPLELPLHSAEVCKLLLSYPSIEVRIRKSLRSGMHATTAQAIDATASLPPAIDTSGIWQGLFVQFAPYPDAVEVTKLLLGRSWD